MSRNEKKRGPTTASGRDWTASGGDPDSDRHPDERDLINLAREELGSRKSERILAHCRNCPPCADRLLELVREHAPPPGPLRLSRWQKFSIVLFVVTLVLLVVLLVWWIRALPEQLDAGIPPTPESPPAEEAEASPSTGPEARLEPGGAVPGRP